MNLKRFEDYLERSEKLLRYDEYKADSERLGHELDEERRTHTNDVRQLKVEVAGLRTLRLRYRETSYSLEEFDSLVKRRLQEFKEKEIQDAVNRRWTTESPILLEKWMNVESQSYPRRCSPRFKSLVEALAMNRANEILRKREDWPQWFVEQYKKEIGEGIVGLGYGIYKIFRP